MQNAGFGGPRATVELKFMNRGDKMHEFSNCGHRFDARENLPSMERVISNLRDFTIPQPQRGAGALHGQRVRDA